MYSRRNRGRLSSKLARDTYVRPVSRRGLGCQAILQGVA